jgi:arylsulfatase A-like enzyme
VGQVIDLLPTCIDLAGVSYPSQSAGNEVTPVAGRSLRPILAGENFERPEGLFFEHQGNAAVRDGKWKLVRAHGKPWSLYDLDVDRTELNDLAKAHPDRVAALTAKWKAWAEKVGAQPWPVKRKKGK